MANKRIDYIDWLKGLSIICVVWFHSPHPEWLNFSFRMPLFFLLSGIFFKIVPFRTYAARKTNQLLVPFFVFYVIYYFYMMLEYKFSPTHEGVDFDPGIFFDLFAAHDGKTGFFVNTPLWFIAALINLQIMLHVLVRSLRKRWLVMTAGVALSLAGYYWILPHDSYFMFGRSLQYLGYYTFGHLYGRSILQVVEKSGRHRSMLTAVSIAVMAATVIIATGGDNPWQFPAAYVFNIALVMALIVLFRYVSRVRALRFFHFYGRNSYVVLGMHYMVVQMFYVIFAMTDTPCNLVSGICVMVVTMLLMVPMINLGNRYCPKLIGREAAINFSTLRRRMSLR